MWKPYRQRISINLLRMNLNKEFNEYIVSRLLACRYIDPITKCWEWTGSITVYGYGQINYKTKVYKVNRLIAYICLGLDLDDDSQFACHRCDNRKCFNPLHIFIGSSIDNMRDAARKGRMNNGKKDITHCPQGHEYAEENTYRYNGERQCYMCRRERTNVSNANRIKRGSK